MNTDDRDHSLRRDVELILRQYSYGDAQSVRLVGVGLERAKREIVALMIDRAGQGWFSPETECSP